jgi:signal transduction histidine kinase/DNA-binding response OmpR family regulator
MTDASVRTLLVEDNAADAALLKKELADSPFGPFVVTHVKRLDEALVRAKAEHFDAVLLDIGLPDSQGLSTLTRMRESLPREIPIVVLTGFRDEALAVQAVKEGAQDYLVKGASGDSMRARSVRYAVERKRADEAVLASEQRLSLMMEAVDIGIFEWDLLSGKITRPDYQKLVYGRPVEQIDPTFHGFEQCLHPDDRAAVVAKIEESVALGHDYRLEFRVLWPDGSEHWIEARAKMFRDAHHKPSRVMGTVADISERKAAEAAARLRDAELAHLSRVSTMGQMASGLAHELNQPLSAIMNFAAVCRESMQASAGLSADAYSAIEEVMNEARRAGAIIARMRAFVRKQEPPRALLEVNELVRETLRLTDFEFQHQRIQPHLELQENLPKVLGDAVQLEQVLVNLLYNALDAMREADGAGNALTVQTGLHQESQLIQVCVTDAGCGMTQRQLERLFEPFFTTKSNGLGMGLNISRSIIESHGGRLFATPNPGKGMRFCFTLPIESGATYAEGTHQHCPYH